MTSPQESMRLRVLRELCLLDAPEDPSLRTIAEAAAAACGMAMGAVSLVDADRQYFTASAGLPVRQTAREASFCSVAIRTPERPLLVPDAWRDPRFAQNPLVAGQLRVRSYAGVPLTLPDSVTVGALCVLGTEPATLSAAQLERLTELAAVAADLLQARRESHQLRQAAAELAAAREAEAASRRQFASVFDKAPVAMSMVELDGTIVQANAAFAALLDRRPEQLAGLPIRQVTDAADTRADRDIAEQLRAGHRASILREKRYVRADGELVPALVTSALVPLTGTGPPVLFNTVEPVDQRRAAEARLMELQSAYDGIVSIDEHGVVTNWNLGAERLFGWPASHMLGHSLAEIIPPDLRAAHQGGVARLAAGGTPRLVDSTILVPAITSDGRRLDIELSLSRWDQDGRAGFTAILRDVTARERTALLAGVVRHAVDVANASTSVRQAFARVLGEVCDRLGWRAAQGWTADADRACWFVTEHPHADGGPCPLHPLAERGHVPSVDVVPPVNATDHAEASELLGSPGDRAIPACALGGASVVPVLSGDQRLATLVFYRPAGQPVPDAELLAALDQIAAALGRVVERSRAAALLQHEAGHDPLTDLVNRRGLLEAISGQQRQLAGDPGHRAALVLLDLQRFGDVNASFGHPVGDQLLREVGRRLRAVAPGHLVARLGGDEFVVLAGGFPRNAHRAALALAEQLVAALHVPFQVAGQRLTVRTSAGVCVLDAGHAPVAHSPAAVLRDADAALRHAKLTGLAGPAMFDTALREQAARRLTDETALGQAIASESLELHYQPLIDLRTGLPVGAEALVRWPRPGHGMVGPDRFIPLAEQSGLIVELGAFVLRRACQDAAGWAVSLPSMAAATVSVNVSSRQLTHPRFPCDVAAALGSSGLPPSRLVLEVTETAAIRDRLAAQSVLEGLHAAGIGIALDDFGTGYSSLSYVQTLPADILKIDKSFVDAVAGPGEGTALVEVVLKLAEATGMRTVAEGVESPAQAAALRELGCDRGQGFLWSRPLPLSELAASLSRPTV